MDIFQRLRFAVRRLLKSRASPDRGRLAALGIGANTAIFSLVNTAILRPLPVAEPDASSRSPSRAATTRCKLLLPNYKDFRDRNEVLSGLFATRFAPVSLSRGGNNQRLWGYIVTGNYFEVLGVSAALGRTFTPEEDAAPLAHPVAVISHGCWQRRFGSDPGIVNQTVTLNGHPFTVVGVAPEGFNGTEVLYTPEVWCRDDAGVGRAGQRLARTAQDAEHLRHRPPQAGRHAGAGRGFAQPPRATTRAEYPEENEGQRITLIPRASSAAAARGRAQLRRRADGAVGLVLLLAVRQPREPLLARATGRRREIAICPRWARAARGSSGNC